MSLYTPEFTELKACPTRNGPYRHPQIPGEMPISLGTTRAKHHHTSEVLPKRKVDQPLRPRGGFADKASEALLEVLRSEARQWTARELAERVYGDAGKSRTAASALIRMRVRGEVESTGMSGTGHAVMWRAT